MSERGVTLLETAASLGLAGLLVYASAQTALQAARTLSAVEDQERRLSAARNLLEAARGAPCAPPIDCPPGLRCSVGRRAVGAAVELRAEVGSQADRLGEDQRSTVLAMFTPPPDGCG